MKKTNKLFSLCLAILLLVGALPLSSIHATAATRYEVINPNSITGEDIVAEAKKWANAGASYWSNYTPWQPSIYWRTGYSYNGQTSFDCAGFVSRVLNDCNIRSTNYTPDYGNCVLKDKYGNGYIAISVADFANYGTDITDAVNKAKGGDYSELRPGDVIGWLGTSLGNHVIIYAGFEDGHPKMVEFTGAGYLYRTVTSEYQSCFQFGSRFVKTNSIIKKTYPSNCQIKATRNTKMNALPCSLQTDSNSTVLCEVKKNERFHAVELVLNKVGNLWYKVKLDDGSTGYVPSSSMEFVKGLNDVTISGVKAPSQIAVGNVFCLQGSITTQNNVLSRIFAGVVSNNTLKTGEIETVNDIKSYNLLNSHLDNQCRFDHLSTGVYTYLVTVEYKGYYAKDEHTTATYKEIVDLHSSSFSVINKPTCNHSFGCHTTAPTCTEQGTKKYTCTKCNYSYDEKLSALGHTEKTTTANATCTNNGYMAFICTTCGVELYRTEIPAMGHNYENNVCTNCDNELLVDFGVELSVSDVQAVAGETVTVEIVVNKNVGFTYLNLLLGYDATAMELVSVSNGAIVESLTQGRSYIWAQADNATATGVLATLTFVIKEDAPAGDYAVTVRNLECCNEQELDVAVGITGGTVTVIDFVYGDCNGDNTVNGKDVTRLLRYLAGIDPETGKSETEISRGADCTGDGLVNGKDVTRLLRYLANIDPVTGESSVQLEK